ncbi:hypothetical protein HDK77DRAFT_116196 [Phyllosticta capitalensis]|uniref:Uncharacterized protein n=1 Tax=Phyllosticta capitalensis TaxID=121624 RepID=A0ABR1YQR9_9PEZI
MDERLRDDASQRSGSISGLTSLEDDTDEFGRMLVQAARDEQRIKDAIRGGRQPFSKARTRPRVALTLENLERNNHQTRNSESYAREPYAHHSPVSLNSGSALEPPPQPPREWGRKAKLDTNWLKRIKEPDEEPVALRDDRGTGRSRRGERPLDVTPRKNTNLHFPSVEGSPDTLRHIIQETPSSTKRYNASLQDWDLTEDLTSGSLLASTPAIPRNTRLHDIRQLEIESVKEPDVEPPNFDHIWKKSPSETRPNRKSLASKDNVNPPKLTLQERSESDRNLPQERTTGPKAPANPINREHASAQIPVTVYKSPPDEKRSGINQKPVQAEKAITRPKSRRDDSHDLLRRLARAASNSPSPGREAEESAQVRRQPHLQKVSPLAERRPQNPNQDRKGKSRAMDPKGIPTPPPDSDEHVPRATNSDANGKPRRRSGSTRANEPAPASDSTSNKRTEPVSEKTPVVSGAWVDTPAAVPNHENGIKEEDTDTPSRSRSTSRTRTSKEEAHTNEARPKKAEIREAPPPSPRKQDWQIKNPTLPKSALSAVIGRAKIAEEAYGDSTLDSLQGIMSADNTVDLDMDENTLDEFQVPSGKPKTAAERERQQELLQLQNMNARLRATRKSIRDANRNMRHLENRVEAGGETAAAVEVATEDSQRNGAVAPAVVVRGQDSPCGEGQCYAYQHPFRTMWRAFKSLFWNEKGRGRYTRLTWFGLFCILFWSWFWTETFLCDKYCQPLYAEYMEGYGVNPNAPRVPYVTLEVASWVPPFKWLKPGALWVGSTIGPVLSEILRLVYDPEAATERMFQENLRAHYSRARNTAHQRFDL